jgi:pimeloyl-ACP methyl ester carboxylesterase
MFEPLLTRLGGQLHMIAPDYPGFGHSDAPTPKEFSYTFDNIATVMNQRDQLAYPKYRVQ